MTSQPQAGPIHHRGVDGAKIIHSGSISMRSIINYAPTRYEAFGGTGNAADLRDSDKLNFNTFTCLANTFNTMDIWLRTAKVQPGIGQFKKSGKLCCVVRFVCAPQKLLLSCQLNTIFKDKTDPSIVAFWEREKK